MGMHSLPQEWTVKKVRKEKRDTNLSEMNLEEINLSPVDLSDMEMSGTSEYAASGQGKQVWKEVASPEEEPLSS